MVLLREGARIAMNNCPNCEQPLQTQIGTIGGVGFGTTTSQGQIELCLNPSCLVGSLNLQANQQAQPVS